MTPAALHSIWLVPAAEEARALAAEIARIATRTGTAAFAPHVTLIGDNAAPLPRLEAAVDALARSTPPLTARITALAGETKRFRALYLALQPGPGLTGLRRALAESLPPEAGHGAFRPHLSLGYGPRAHAHRTAAARGLALWCGRSLRFDRVQIVRSAATIPVADWEILDSRPLRRTPNL
ncbi:2'-5' RNA ligase family protein [Rhodobacter maris]|uniref:2'-5' RNA ligase superfamily protein n=1 Tax=Rhodobacter maris TaxID=446682 RepID=A0A285S6K5_9RHOB|nr:2'-5' RNA ligase family protein [Rhodobacter maris]SOC03053.1 2'-5' RNA ligase superfamily protein [Rhodobacter maris]